MKISNAILPLIFLLALVAGCTGNSQSVSKSSEISGVSKWDYEVFSFRVEVTGRNGMGHAMRFNVASTQFDSTVQEIEESGWQYVGVIHSANELANNVTYVLFRRPVS